MVKKTIHPKFEYRQRVRISNGFYRGVYITLFSYDKDHGYSGYVNPGNKHSHPADFIWFAEDYLEAI